MKQSSNSRRQRGRGNGKRPSKNHSFDSNGPEVRVRGNAHQVYEKYLTLARDAMSGGDRIASENYFQHAEHYFRILNQQQENANSDDGRNQGNRNRRQRGNGQNGDGNEQNNGTEQAAAGENAAKTDGADTNKPANPEATVEAVPAGGGNQESQSDSGESLASVSFLKPQPDGDTAADMTAEDDDDKSAAPAPAE